MSWGAVDWAKTWRGELTSSRRFVLYTIAEHFNEQELRAWPSTKRLADLTGLNRRTVTRCIKTLDELGLIEIEHRFAPDGSKAANRYALPLYNPLSTALRKPGELPVENAA